MESVRVAIRVAISFKWLPGEFLTGAQHAVHRSDASRDRRCDRVAVDLRRHARRFVTEDIGDVFERNTRLTQQRARRTSDIQ